MELVEVEIVAQVITARYGTLSTGDILKTDQAFADHLVNDCKGAKWPDPKAAPAVPEEGAQLAAAAVADAEQTTPDAVSIPATGDVSQEDSKPTAKIVKKAAK